MINALTSTDAELGLAFDGDGDRLGIVTKDGHNIYPDRQMMLFARDVLSRVPGGTVVYDVKCSQRLAPEIAAAGGVPLMYKTGHSLIKAKMKEVNAEMAVTPEEQAEKERKRAIIAAAMERARLKKAADAGTSS